MMQIETKFIPRMGTDIDFFERLSDYIIQFDPEWIKRIKSASSQDIQLLIELSGIKTKGVDIPKYYQIFLEKMGENDGGLITSKYGTSHMNEIIELYQEIHQFEVETLNNNYLIFYNVNLASQIAMETGQGENPLVVDFSDGKAYDIRAENFEKYLFQCAFQKYVKFKYTISFSASGKMLEDSLVKSNNLDKKIFDLLKGTMNQNDLKEIWIGDEWHYIGFNHKVSCYIKHIKLGLGIIGYVTGNDENDTMNLAKQFADKLGAHLK